MSCPENSTYNYLPPGSCGVGTEPTWLTSPPRVQLRFGEKAVCSPPQRGRTTSASPAFRGPCVKGAKGPQPGTTPPFLSPTYFSHGGDGNSTVGGHFITGGALLQHAEKDGFGRCSGRWWKTAKFDKLQRNAEMAKTCVKYGSIVVTIPCPCRTAHYVERLH